MCCVWILVPQLGNELDRKWKEKEELHFAEISILLFHFKKVLKYLINQKQTNKNYTINKQQKKPTYLDILFYMQLNLFWSKTIIFLFFIGIMSIIEISI